MKTNERGLTLIEVMISVGILALVCVSSFYILIQAQQMAEDNRKRLLAVNAARSVLELIKETPAGKISTINADDYVPSSLTGGDITITTNPANLSVASIGTVTVTVTWQGAKAAARSLQVTTMRSKYV